MNEERADLLSRMRVASPCPASWEAMEGDGRVRFCRLCDLHVYNVSELTRAEAESLVARTEGRLCARLYRRADGEAVGLDLALGVEVEVTVGVIVTDDPMTRGGNGVTVFDSRQITKLPYP